MRRKNCQQSSDLSVSFQKKNVGAYALLVPEHACSPPGGVCSRLEPGWLAFRGPSAPRLCARLSQGTGMVARPQSRPNRRVRIAAEQCTIKDPLLFSSVEAKWSFPGTSREQASVGLHGLQCVELEDNFWFSFLSSPKDTWLLGGHLGHWVSSLKAHFWNVKQENDHYWFGSLSRETGHS